MTDLSRAAGRGAPYPPEPSLSQLIGRLRRAIRRRIPVDPELPESHIEILRLLYRSPGMRVQEVAAELRLAPNTVSTLVQQLVRSGRVHRETDAKDRRSARLTLTPLARRRIAKRLDVRRSVVDGAMTSLGAEDRTAIEAAIPALTRLADTLEERS